MKEELEQIAISLAKWCKKYNKDYMSIWFTDETICGSLDVKDKDHDECDIYISKSQLKEILNKEEK